MASFFLFRWFRRRREKRQKRKLLKKIHRRGLKLVRKPIIEAKGRVIAGLLNVREKPSLSARVVGQLKKNSLVRILNKWEDWYQIVWKRRTVAYVYAKYIQIEREEKTGIVMANLLNVRSKPSLEAPILGKLKKGETVLVLKEYDQWLKINYKNRAAYVYKTYIKLDDIPIKIDIPEEFFHQRKDLANIPLEPKKKYPLPKDYYERIVVEIWNKYGNLIEKLSKELKIDISTAISVLAVESRGKGFVDGRLLIRFENHVFWLFWGKTHPEKFHQHFKFNPDRRREGHYFRESPNARWEVCHTSQDMEWKVFEFAKKLSETDALKSISMGAPQVMGFNYKMIGYDSPQQMFEKFQRDIRYHIFALFDFTKAKPERIRYLQKRDFYKFAYEYNGPTDPKGYEQRFLKFYKIAIKLLD